MPRQLVLPFAAIILIFCCFQNSAADEISDLRTLVEKQQKKIEAQASVIDTLLERVGALENQKAGSRQESAPKKSVDLTYEETPLVESEAHQEHTLAKEWFRRFDITGFGAAGFLWTGRDARRPTGGFLNYEASLFVDAEVWKDIAFFTEIQTIRLGDEDTKWLRTAEVYIHFKNLFKNVREDLLGIKAGRMDIPFGEEYLWHDAIDNPLITPTVNWPYGWDEGVLFYGRLGKLGWVSSLMDGNDTRGTDDDLDPSFNLKIFGSPVKPLYLSASFMRNGKSAKSALEFAGSHIEPVGRGGHASTLGISPSVKVQSYLYELDAKVHFNQKGHLWLNFGEVFIDDESPGFDRNILYFSLEPLVNLTEKFYLLYRFSGIGTFNSSKGYHFDGKPWADGNSVMGYDAKSLLRHAWGFGYRLNPRTIIKLEYSRDDFTAIKASGRNPGRHRDLVGAQATVKF